MVVITLIIISPKKICIEMDYFERLLAKLFFQLQVNTDKYGGFDVGKGDGRRDSNLNTLCGCFTNQLFRLKSGITKLFFNFGNI